MKQFLMTLSGLTILTLAGTNSINNANLMINNSLPKTKVNDNATSLFNYKYGYLSDSDIITIQSTTDHKFYSYDTSALKNYTFPNARDVFLVDNTTGDLVYNKDVTIPSDQKIDIENTRQEMITARKITTVKDDYNPYSKSEYSKTYFDGDNNDWQYVQLGGLPNHINISQQSGADKVEYSDSLSEAFGLYYIAKAEKNGQIDQSVADNLATYFMSQTSIKDSFNNKLTNIIIDLINKNNNIFKFIQDTLLSVVDKNNSINYIFDKDNKLVEVYYNKFNKDTINNNISYNYSAGYNGTNSSDRIDGPNIILLSSWKKYARDWESFLKIYPTLSFDNSSYIEVKSQYGKDNRAGSQLNINSTDINKDQLWYIENKHDGGVFGATVVLQAWVLIAHDDNNIYLRWHITEFAQYATEGLHFSICVNNCSFSNSMA